MSNNLKSYLLEKGIACSRTTPYHPIGNAQCERYNGVLWKAIRCALKSRNLPVAKWESVIPNALDSVRSLLCTSTGETPHSRFLRFERRSNYGKSLPEWLSKPGPVLLRKFVRASKTDDLVQRVDLIEANPVYARVRYSDGRESNVSLRDIARCPRDEDLTGDNRDYEQSDLPKSNDVVDREPVNQEDKVSLTDIEPAIADNVNENDGNVITPDRGETSCDQRSVISEPRRSSRKNKGIPPERFGY